MAQNGTASRPVKDYELQFFNFSVTAQRAALANLLSNGFVAPSNNAAGWQEGAQILEVTTGLRLILSKGVSGGPAGWAGVGCVVNRYVSAGVIAANRYVRYTGNGIVAQNTVADGPCDGIALHAAGDVGQYVHVLTSGRYYVVSNEVTTFGSYSSSDNAGRSIILNAPGVYMGRVEVPQLVIDTVTYDLVNFHGPVIGPAT